MSIEKEILFPETNIRIAAIDYIDIGMCLSENNMSPQYVMRQL